MSLLADAKGESPSQFRNRQTGTGRRIPSKTAQGAFRRSSHTCPAKFPPPRDTPISPDQQGSRAYVLAKLQQPEY